MPGAKPVDEATPPVPSQASSADSYDALESRGRRRDRPRGRARGPPGRRYIKKLSHGQRAKASPWSLKLEFGKVTPDSTRGRYSASFDVLLNAITAYVGRAAQGEQGMLAKEKRPVRQLGSRSTTAAPAPPMAASGPHKGPFARFFGMGGPVKATVFFDSRTTEWGDPCSGLVLQVGLQEKFSRTS